MPPRSPRPPARGGLPPGVARWPATRAPRVHAGARGRSRDTDREVRRRVEGWLQESGAVYAEAPAIEGFAFVLLVRYPPSDPSSRIQVMRPVEERVTVLLLAAEAVIQFADGTPLFSEEDQDALLRLLKGIAVSSGEVGFEIRLSDGARCTWSLELPLYDDALTQHRFNTSLRRVFLRHLEILTTLEDLVRPLVAHEPETAGTGITGYG